MSDEDDNLSGADSGERWLFDREQELLRADPAYAEWLEFINTQALEHDDGLRRTG